MTRNELAEMIALAKRLLAVDEPGVLATLFSSNGSTYRRLGSMMVSGAGSIHAGGVSGGCVEQYVARHGRTLVRENSAAMLSFDADPNGEDAGKPTLGCGGSIEVLVERLTAEHLTFLQQLSTAMTSDTPSTAACVVDTSSMSVERKWVNDDEEDTFLGHLRDRVVSRKASYETALDTSRRVLLQYVPAMTRLVVLGAGDDVKPLCTTARSLGWHVTIADRRGRLATQNRFPDADRVLTGADWSQVVDPIDFTPRTAVVLMTHSIADDVAALPLISDKPIAYVGMLGPAHRKQWVLDGVAETCPLSEKFASRLRGPIGLDLGDRSAMGIAISVVAEILAVLNERDTPRARMTQVGGRAQHADFGRRKHRRAAHAR